MCVCTDVFADKILEDDFIFREKRVYFDSIH